MLGTQLIKRHEGFRNTVYTCTAGKITIGYGRNLEDNGITEEEGTMMLERDLRDWVHPTLRDIFRESISNINADRYAALQSMLYTLGGPRFREFVKFIAAVQSNDWDAAHDEIIDSKWWRDEATKGRAEEIAMIFKTGEIKHV